MSAYLWGGKVVKGPSTGIVPHKSLFEKSLPKKIFIIFRCIK
jgi:hypothetical protein